MSGLAKSTVEPTRIPNGHLPAIRKLVRCADKYRSAATVLETYVEEYDQFRTLQALNRVNVSEANMNRAREALDQAIDELRAFTETRKDAV